MAPLRKHRTCAEPTGQQASNLGLQRWSADWCDRTSILTRARRAVRSVLGVMRTHYPGFILGLPLRRGEVPVFVYHEVDPAQFAGDLDFLRRNRYRTLSLAEFVRARERKSGRIGRSVLLTFDDARRNFYDCAWPVLRDYEARATLFAPSYWMSAAARSADRERFMSWEQLRETLTSGRIDVQSHAHRHTLVFTSRRLLDFANPYTLAHYDIFDWPMRNTSAGEELGRPPLGTPIYAASPLLSASRRFMEDPLVTQACLDRVCRGGGESFFGRPDWLASLRQVHAAHAAAGRWADERTLRTLIASEFEQSRELFLTQLGYSPQYLAYPWMMGSPLSLELAQRFGLRGVFGVALDFRRARANLPVRAFGRLKADWLRLLPGSGRTSLLSIAAGKVAGIARTQHLAH
jgi:peptidoglycan/xylan/chitin deacetylase (PgdA/CDA1 family)